MDATGSDPTAGYGVGVTARLHRSLDQPRHRPPRQWPPWWRGPDFSSTLQNRI